MTWAFPEALWLLLLTPVLWPLWRWRERARPTLRHPDLRLLQGPPTARALWARRIPFWGRLLTIGLLIFALSGPRWPLLGSRIPTEGIAFMMVVDVSGSMGERDVQWAGQPVTRLEAAQAVLKQFIQGGEGLSYRGNDALGLVTFSVRPIDVCPPTLSHDSVRYFLEGAKPIGKVPDSGTNIGDALAVAINLLVRSPIKSKAILLISDGEHNVPKEIDAEALGPRQSAQIAAALGVRVHTIFLAGAPRPETSATQQQAQAALRDVALLTKGESAVAEDGAALGQISQKLDALEKSRLETFLYTQHTEAGPWLVLAALVCLVGTVVVEETWLRVTP